MKVAIAVPSMEMLHADFCFSLCALMAYVSRERNDIHLVILNEKNSVVEVARHRLVIMAKGLQAEYILFLDSDMTFPPETLSTLLDSKKSIIGCSAPIRTPPNPLNAFNLDGTQVTYEEKGTQEVLKVGTGVLLVKTSVFDEIGKPYFKIDYDVRTEMWEGEDLNLCRRARMAGIKIWVDHELSKKIKHIGTKQYGYEVKKC